MSRSTNVKASVPSCAERMRPRKALGAVLMDFLRAHLPLHDLYLLAKEPVLRNGLGRM